MPPDKKEKVMKKTKKIIAMLLALALMLAAVMGTLVSCKDPGDNDDDSSQDQGGNSDDKPDSKPGENISYTVSVKTAGGMPMAGVMVVIYEDNTLETIAGKSFKKTDANGVVSFSLPESSSYAIELSEVPDGYGVESYYSFTGSSANITLTSLIQPDTGLSGVKYKLGDIMRDFTITDIDGNKITLSKLFTEQDKDLVMLNFWYVDCSACKLEFPALEESYQAYSDKVAVIAINPMSQSDSLTDIKLFRGEYGLSFDVAQDIGLANAFGVGSYPTSVFIDRYGAITFIEVGALTETKYFDKIFEHYIGADYQQKIITTYEDISPVEKPNVDMPSSDDIKAVISPDESFVYSAETGTADAEFSWPFIIAEKNGVACIKSSNAKKDASFAILHVEAALKAGEALGLEYFSSSELGADMLYILVDGVSVSTISGEGTDWETCYPYVALEDGTYDVTFIYLKDSTTDTGDDCIYFKRLFIESDINNIEEDTYIPHWAATVPNSNGIGYQKYVDVVLGEDGYYHVGSATGPLLLANLMGVTQFSSEDSVYSIVYNSLASGGSLAQYYDAVIKYCNYASNAEINGLCTVDETLAGYLKTIAAAVGYEKENDKAWLQFCLYYKAYGTDGKELSDPIAGLAPHSAYKAVLNAEVGLEEYPNVYVYNRPIMPRGLWFEFIPEVSGAYRIVSNVDKNSTNIEESLNGWIFLADGTVYYQYSISQRLMDDANNVYMYAYFEAGTPYYIDIAYYDIYNYDSFGFKIEYLGEEVDIFRAVSPGAPFTYEIGKGIALFGDDGNPLDPLYGSITMNGGVPTKAFFSDVVYSLAKQGTSDGIGGVYTGTDKDGNAYLTVTIDEASKTVKFDCTAPGAVLSTLTVTYVEVEGEVTETIIPGGTKVVYDADEDRYYNVLPDGTKGESKIYADFTMLTSIFGNKNLAEMIEVGAFNFAMTENDKNGMLYLERFPNDADLREYWGENYEENYELYQMDDLKLGIYHGSGEDLTELARKYYAKIITATTNPMDPDSGVSEYPLEMRGCVEVNAELAGLLQTLMDKYTFEGVENSWVKLCYYYETVGEGWEWISELR